MIGPVADLLDGYGDAGTWDEMFRDPDEPRPAYRALHDTVLTLSADEFDERCRLPRRPASATRASRSRSRARSGRSRSTSCPASSPPTSGRSIERGVAQRVRALEAFLADVYGRGEILADGVVPRRLVTSSTHFHAGRGRHRAAQRRAGPRGRHRPRPRRATARFRVLEDNLRTPSGISYVVENRRAMTHVFPELFASHRVRPVADYPATLLEALRAAAPAGADDPTVVVLTPGVHNSAYFEHAFLARQMGVELVEGRDLVCRDGVVCDAHHRRASSGST